MPLPIRPRTFARFFLAGSLSLLVISAGCKRSEPPQPKPHPGSTAWFSEVTHELGLSFVHDAGSVGSYFMPQMMGSGVALLRLGWLAEERLSLSLDGELGAPLIRHTFSFRTPNTPLFSVPSLGAGMKVGVGLRFP